MRLVCFDPDLQGEGGCFTSGSRSSRSKRGGISSEEQPLGNSAPVKRRLMCIVKCIIIVILMHVLQGEVLSPFTLKRGAVLQQTVPSSGSLRFQSGALQILNEKGGTQTFNEIQNLVTYNEINGVSSVSASNVTVMLKGFGESISVYSNELINDFYR